VIEDSADRGGIGFCRGEHRNSMATRIAKGNPGHALNLENTLSYKLS
jgi:hypothetical protein